MITPSDGGDAGDSVLAGSLDGGDAGDGGDVGDGGLPDDAGDGGDGGLTDGGDGGIPDAGDSGPVCLIGGQIFASRALNPTDLTLCCNPVANPTGWTDALVAGPTYALGSSPTDITTGDFNGDGFLDVAVCDNLDQNISVFLALDDGGGFRDRIITPMTNAGAGCGMASGDLNGDQRTDLIVATGTAVAVFISQGDGHFAPEVDYLSGNSITRVAVGDFDRDGWYDVVSSDFGGAINVLFNEGLGDGVLGTPQPYDAGLHSIGQLRVGDFNGDHWPDFAVNSLAGKLLFALNQGDGGFNPPVVNTAIPAPVASWPGPLGDGGVDDLAVSCVSKSERTWVVGQDLGGLTKASSYDSGVDTANMFIADMDTDGHQDIITTGEGWIVILYNAGDGTFLPPARRQLPQNTQGMIGGVFNHNGASDVVLFYAFGDLQLWRNGCP
jgi:hypothetical protein